MPYSFWLEHFLDSRAEIYHILGLFYGKLNTPKSHSEINWPLLKVAQSRKVSNPSLMKPMTNPMHLKLKNWKNANFVIRNSSWILSFKSMKKYLMAENLKKIIGVIDAIWNSAPLADFYCIKKSAKELQKYQ